jgi:hypothetical protein
MVLFWIEFGHETWAWNNRYLGVKSKELRVRSEELTIKSSK